MEQFCKVLSSDALAAGQGDSTGINTEAESRREWFRYTLAQLRAFARKYHGPAASFADLLEQDMFAEGKVPRDVRESLIQSLHP